MKINNLQGVSGVYNKYKATPNKSVAFSDYMSGENVEISQKGKDFAFAMEKLKNTPEIREEKVNKIKSDIQRGMYKIDSNKLARAILLGDINE